MLDGFDSFVEQLVNTVKHVLISLAALVIAGAIAWFVLSSMEAL